MSISQLLTIALAALLPAAAVLQAQESKAIPTAPAVPLSGAAAASGNYVLKPNDEITIRVYRNPELDGPRRISKDGTIDFPLLGIVNLAGKTQYEAGSHLAALLDKDYLVRPQVFVTLLSTTKRHFNVLGQVTSPGTKEFPDDQPMDILSAISAAGGFTRLANQSGIVVRRQQDGRDQTFKVDVKKLTKDGGGKPFTVLPNDTIVVEERFF